MKQRSVSVRINLLILMLVILICGGLVTAAYWNNSRQIDETYMNRTSQISASSIQPIFIFQKQSG